MQKKQINKLIFYLYNYNNIDKLIKQRENEIIDSINVSHNAWIKSISGTGNTLEDTAIKLINDYKIIEYKRWQVFLKGILVFLCKKFPIGYQYIILKYFEKTDIKKISEFLKIDFK